MNTVFEDLELNRGAVSNAIFGVAGAKLQQLVKAKNASGSVGEIIVTEGCKLKRRFTNCRKIFSDDRGRQHRLLKENCSDAK